MTHRRTLVVLLLCCLAGLGVPFPLGYTYTDRLADRPGMYLISVTDHAAPQLPPRPRHTFVVVLDGLGYKEGQNMRSVQQLRERGQCWKTDVGSLPMSRPVYAVLSTGVEQDRGGALTNDATVAHGAQSIWDLARAAGLSVAAVSELSWWRDLFPRGFATYLMPPRSADYFRLAPAADLVLIHPIHIDESGHAEGADSAAYRAAVERADRELSDFLGTLDLQRDLVLVTADHGHSPGGGHGGTQDRVSNVLSCFAGVGVQQRPQLGTLRMTSLGPAVALLLGLPFPASMRAGDDSLDALWDIADPRALPAAYLQDRRQAVERFRAENRAQLARWLPHSGGSWSAFYATARQHHAAMVVPIAGLMGLLLALHMRGHRKLTPKRSGHLFGVLWIVGCAVAAYALQAGLRGSFDMSSVNHRASFIRFTVGLGATVSLSALAVHLALRRCLRALLWDLSALSLLGTLACLAHPALFGWHVGFPVPPPPAYFFPYFAALFLSALNGAALLVCVACAVGLPKLLHWGARASGAPLPSTGLG